MKIHLLQDESDVRAAYVSKQDDRGLCLVDLDLFCWLVASLEEVSTKRHGTKHSGANARN